MDQDTKVICLGASITRDSLIIFDKFSVNFTRHRLEALGIHQKREEGRGGLWAMRQIAS